MSLSFTIPGIPIPQERPFVTRHGTFDRKRSKDAKKVIAQYALYALCEAKSKTLGPECKSQISIIARFFGVRPNADIDNCYKLVSDAIQGVLFYNDSQIWHVHMHKLVCNKGDERTEIEVIGL